MVKPLQWDSYRSFQREVRGERLCILSEESKDFLDKLLVISSEKWTNLSSQTQLWRARLGEEEVQIGKDDWTVQSFSIEQMGAPPADKAKGGRINCKGIPVLYVSSDEETAMSEVRPWRGQRISVARFSLLRDVRLVDFCVNEFDGTAKDLDLLWPLHHIINKKPITKAEHENILWRWIGYAFATPVAETEDAVDYVPTQIIAEAIKDNGYDGVSYRSSVADGVNYALFDVKKCAKIEESKLMYTQSIKYKFSSKQFM